MTLLSESESHSVMLDCDPMDCPWDSPGQNTGAGSFSLLQQMIPTQGSNPGLPYYRQIPYQLSHKGSPAKGAGKARTGWPQILKTEKESMEKR